MITPAPVRIAIVGVGLIGPRHAQAVIDDKNAILAAIVDPMPQGALLAEKLGVPHYASVNAMVNSDDKPDGALICTPNHTHVAIGCELARAGVHVLVEKPISTDIETGRNLIKVAQESGVKLLVGHHRRFNSYIMAAKEVIASGKLGQIIAVNGLWTNLKPDDYFNPPTEWRRLKTGGVILINMVHEVDLMHELLGPIVRVYAEPMPRRRGFEAEEGAALTFKFQSGAVGSFFVSDNVVSPHSFEGGTGENPLIPRSGKDFYRIFGSDATLSVPDLTRWSYDGKPAKSWVEEMTIDQIAVDNGVPFRNQVAHFVEVIRGSQEPKCSGEAGLAALIVCDAIKRSMESGRPINIDP